MQEGAACVGVAVGADGQAVHGPVVGVGQAGGGAVAQGAAQGVEEQDRAEHALGLGFEAAYQLVEDEGQRRAAGNHFEDAVLGRLQAGDTFLLAHVVGDAEIADGALSAGGDRRDDLGDMHEAVILAQPAALALVDIGRVAGRDRGAGFVGGLEVIKLQLASGFCGRVAQQVFGAAVEHGDEALAVGGNDRHFRGRVQHALQQAIAACHAPVKKKHRHQCQGDQSRRGGGAPAPLTEHFSLGNADNNVQREVFEPLEAGGPLDAVEVACFGQGAGFPAFEDQLVSRVGEFGRVD